MGDQASGLLSPFLRKRRIETALPYLKGSVLDYGCGVGALAGYIMPDRYVGIDDDPASIDIAKKMFPLHTFLLTADLFSLKKTFNSIALLAVIEHVDNAVELLGKLRALCASKSVIVLTTPAPFAEPLHGIGAAIGLFSREAQKDHKRLLGYKEINSMAKTAGFHITACKRFLLGMNQLFVLEVV